MGKDVAITVQWALPLSLGSAGIPGELLLTISSGRCGVNLKWLAEYCGTSVAMIEPSYGRFLAAGADHQLALLAGGAVAAVRAAAEAG